MSTNFKIVHKLNEKKWRQFVSDHPDGNIFHTPDFFHIFENTKNHRPELWCCLDAEERILSLFMPVFITFIPLLKAMTTRAICYGGILAENSELGFTALNYLFERYIAKYDNRILLTEVRNFADSAHLKETLRQNGFQYHDYLNYVINLDRDPDQILEDVRKNARKRLRHAMKANPVQIHECYQSEQLENVYHLLKHTYRHKRVPLADFSLFRNAFEILFPKKSIKILLASIDDQYVATSIELYYKDVVYGWYGGFNRWYGRYNVNEILTWHILKSNAQNGCKIYDFGGAGYPDETYGVRDFKAKFGGELVNYGRYSRVHSPVWCYLSKIAYAVYRKIPR